MKTDYLQILEDAWKLHLEPKVQNAPTVISTFAGCGGSSLGYSMAGYKELLAVEWEQNAVDTFRLNFPEVSVYHGDIAELSVEKILELTDLKVGELDVFDGSPPCQGFSTAGKREMSDSRNYLFKEYARLLIGLKPKVFVMENVSGMIKGKMKLIFAEILRELKSCGYQVKAMLLNAMHYNVPQSRQRMIFIGVREDLEIEPSFPKGSNQIIPCARLDERASKYSEKRYGDKLVTENKPLRTIVRLNRLFWNREKELGIKSYAYGASIPSQFSFNGSFQDAKNRIGNSVPPLFMKAIAEHIRREILERID